MIRILLLILLPLFAFAQQETLTPQQEVEAIDQQIEELQDLQEKYSSSAKRNASNAMRWQFQKENYFDARRAWDQAALDKKKVEEIQIQVDDLEARKQILNAK